MQTLFLGETTPQGCFKITRATADSLIIEARSRRFPEAVGVVTRVSGYDVTSSDIYYDGEVTITCGG